jgi:hypothetical protein
MAQRRRTDGLSDDGLSYSVATDFDKQLGQALAQIDARAAAPRFTPGAMVERPDAPDLLQQELLAPVMAARNAFEGIQPQAQRPVAPKTYEIGNELVSLDTISGTPKVLYSAPQKAAPEMTPRQKLEYTDLLSTRRTLMGKPFPTKADQERVAAIDEQIKTFFPEQDPAAAPAQVAPPDLLPSVGFMGAPGGTNLFSAPTPKESLANTNAPGKRIGRFRLLAQ